MNGGKNNTMNSESCLGEKTDHEKFEIKEEKLFTPMTLDKKELIESDKNCHVLQDKKDTESLESIQNYAQRIKSFLGWEPNVEEQELEYEGDEVKALDGKSVHNSFGSSINSESTDAGQKTPEEKVELPSAVSSGEETEKEELENTMDEVKNERNSNDDNGNESTDGLIKRSEDILIETNDGEKKEQYLTPHKENIETDIENNNIVHSLSNSKNDTLENKYANRDSDDINKQVANTSETEKLYSPSNSTDSIDLHIDLKRNDSLPHEDVKDKKTFAINSDMNISDIIQDEDNRLAESQTHDINKPSGGSKKEGELCEHILPGSDHQDHIHECFGESDKSGSESLETEYKKLVPEQKETEKLDSTRISDLKPDVGKSNSPSISEDMKDSTSDIELLKERNENEDSKLMLSEMVQSLPEGNLSVKKEEVKHDDTEPKETDPSESLTEDIRTGKNNVDDLRSEDSLDLYEDFPFENDVPSHYVKEIRRLSRGIVRDVIESARSSVHELYASKSENLDTTCLSENLGSYDRVMDSEEFYFNSMKPEEEDSLGSNGKSSNENFNSNLKHKSDQPIMDQDVTDEDAVCGFGCFRPKWIQKYATPRAYLVLFSIIGVIHGGYYSYVVSILSTLEKRYAFKTKVSGTLLLADEITPLLLGILVGYIGGRTHRPRMVALGMFMSAACCFISGLPYLIYGAPRHTTDFGENYKPRPKICESGLKSDYCSSDEQPPTLSVVGLFLLASFLKGFATLSFYVIGMSYMDDIIKRKNSPMYFAITLSLRLLGPLVGYLMSSGFLKYYENPTYDPGFGPDDPRWIGAWWIGFFLQGILLVIFTIPIAFFPRRLPGQKKMQSNASVDSENGLTETFAGLISALKRLAKNPFFIVLIINTTMNIFGNFGHAIMLPKYVENQFRVSASEASLFSGAITIVCIIISTLSGGFLIWKFKPKTKVILSGMIAAETILCVGFLVLMIPRCETSKMLHFGIDEDGLILNSACNKNCNCSTSSFTPFCGADGTTLYFSPCHAGCTKEVTSSILSEVHKEFGNCTCAAEQELGTTISEGFCPDENCWKQMLAYLIVLFVIVSISNLFTVAATMMLLRSVHPKDKSFALGTFETFICLFGFIPFPVVYGALVDSACLVWEKSCGETGNCWFYDMERYNYLLHGASAVFCFFSVLSLTRLYFLSSRIRNLYVEEEEKEETKYVDIKLDTVYGTGTKL